MSRNRFDKDRLLQVLAEEAGFYRDLHALIGRQRDGLQEDSGVRMCDLFAEIDGVQKRIESSERIIQAARNTAPDDFAGWVSNAEVREVLDEISGLVTQSQDVVTECLRLAQLKRTAYQRELNQMGQGKRLLATMSPPESGPRFLDARQ